MIDVIIADHKELFQVGMAEILAGAEDVCLVLQPRSAEQLLSALKTFTPNVLVLSTSFLGALPRIQSELKGGQTALLLLAENNDRAPYVRWLRAQGVVHRSADGSVFVDARRRVARGELFSQDGSSDARHDPTEVP